MTYVEGGFMNGIDDVVMRVRLAAGLLGVPAAIPGVREMVETVAARNAWGCNQYRHAPGCPHKGTTREGVTSDGNTRIPPRITAGLKRSEVKRRMRAFVKRAREGADVDTGYKVDGHEVVFRGGEKAHWGTSHGDRAAHNKPVSDDEIAETVMHGRREPRDDNSIELRNKTVIVVLAPLKQPTIPKGEPVKEVGAGDPYVVKTWYKTILQ